jgi:DNA-binding NarL/FixJ family response regulator
VRGGFGADDRVGAALVAMLVDPYRAAAGLTVRELQVLRAMGRGRSNAEISRELYLAEDTVKVHVRRLFRKLDVRDRAHAVARGFRAGLLD